jgi:hypothetical protein
LPTDAEKIHEEEVSFSFSRKDKKILFTSIIDLQLKTPESLYIIDFKTTKNPQTYFFVEWEMDVQSLSYLYGKRESKPAGFGYCVFDKENEMILFNSRGPWEDKEEATFLAFIDKFILLHDNASNDKLWKPEKQKCHWCEYSKECSVKK